MQGRLIIGLLLSLMLSMTAALGQESVVGEVESVQLVDASQLGGGDQLVLVLQEGQGFRLPGQRSLAVGAGVRVSVTYRSSVEGGEMPEACSVRVLAVPIEHEGETVMQEAERPFEVYRNESAESEC